MPQARKWQLTFNNPEEHGFTHDVIVEKIEEIASVVYWCLCDEVGSENTYHTHLYIAFKNPKMHTVLSNSFPGAHREIAHGTSMKNPDYVAKDGERFNKQPDGTYDYVDGNGKRHTGTNYADTFLEWGEMPREQQGKSKDAERMVLERIFPQYPVVGYIFLSLFGALTIIFVFKSGILVELFSYQ